MSIADDDGVLAARAREGDQVAFRQLVARHKEPLYRLLRRLSGDPDEAYDLLQETFVALWSSLDRYDAARPFAGWARRIAVNKSRDWARRRMVRRWIAAVLPTGDDAALVADRAPSPEAVVGDAVELRRTERAIAELPASLREALVLTAIEGLSQRQAAEVLGITEKAVETRIGRARASLTRALAATPG